MWDPKPVGYRMPRGALEEMDTDVCADCSEVLLKTKVGLHGAEPLLNSDTILVCACCEEQFSGPIVLGTKWGEA